MRTADESEESRGKVVPPTHNRFCLLSFSRVEVLLGELIKDKVTYGSVVRTVGNEVIPTIKLLLVQQLHLFVYTRLLVDCSHFLA